MSYIKIDISEWEGLEAISEAQLLREMRPAAGVAMKAVLLDFEGIVKRKLSGKRSGRTYRVPGTRRKYVASAPGEAPAKLFGNLQNSIGHDGPNWRGHTVSGEVGPGLGQAPGGGDPDPSKAYGRRLEFGGTDKRGVHIDARPYMAPSQVKFEPRMDRIFRRHLSTR